MDGELISVVIATRNRSGYLREAIDSVLGQTYSPVELIVVDDGSTDDTPAVVASYGDRIAHALRQHHGGCSAARNRGVRRASGPLLAFLDDDDLWLPDKLAFQKRLLDSDPGLDAVYGWSEPFVSPELEPALRRRIRGHTAPAPAPLSSAMLIRRPAFDLVGPFDESLPLAQEIDWHARREEAGVTATIPRRVVHRRRLHAGNQSLVDPHRGQERLRALKAVLDRRRSARPRVTPVQGHDLP